MEEAGAAAAAAEAPPASGRGGAAGTTAAAGGGAKVVWTSLTYGEARGLIAQYLAKQPSKCEARAPAALPPPEAPRGRSRPARVAVAHIRTGCIVLLGMCAG